MPSPRYAPLTRHLSALSGDETEMSFSEVEKILGRRLPNSARGDFARHWWANTKTHSQGQGWLDAGWRVDRVDAERENVRFRCQNSRGVAEAAKPFVPDDGATGLLPAARRMIDDYIEEKGIERADAIVAILNEAALDRRRRTIEWFSARARPQSTDSAELIREDRDAR